jgi:prepilin-type N-terminal cleavage/methylation domain-containing protein|tara:strand:+ start:509 stop:958 length:450 start_codon:yes stop_codon:yes gene_type:complete
MNNSKGFTLIELVVTIVLVGILAASAIPTFNKVILSAQIRTNVSNMETIKNTFMQYNQVNHMDGNPHFPTLPENNQLDSEYKDLVLPDGRTPDNLFSGKNGLPYNSNGNPYSYYQENDTSSTGFITQRITIKDMDLDSPSYEEYVIGEI